MWFGLESFQDFTISCQALSFTCKNHSVTAQLLSASHIKIQTSAGIWDIGYANCIYLCSVGFINLAAFNVWLYLTKGFSLSSPLSTWDSEIFGDLMLDSFL